MKFYCLTLLLFMSVFSGMHAQETSSVISPNGGVARNSLMILEWTIGEIAVESFRSGEKYYTEGFHQPMLKVEPMEEHKLTNDTPSVTIKEEGSNFVRVMPNPVSSALQIEFELSSESEIHIQVYDLSGQVLGSQKHVIHRGSVEFDFSTFTSGMYMLQIRSADGQFVRQCKISKI